MGRTSEGENFKKKTRIVNIERFGVWVFLCVSVCLFSFCFHGVMFWLSHLDEQVFPLPLLSL